MRAIELIRPGTYTAMNGKEITFSEADLRASADAYSPALSEAPLVVGHPTTDAPAYGWVEALNFCGALQATPSQVDPAFAEIVEAGRYKKVSAAFYLPDAVNNPKPGVHYLKHIGFLGAAAPAVKGLRNAQFAAAEDGMITVELSEPPQRTEERTMPQNTTDPAADTAAAAKTLADNEAAFAERVKSFEAEQKRRRHEGIAQFAAEQVKAGRVLPKDKDGLIAFMDAMPAALTVELAEGDSGVKTKQDGLGWLRTFISGLPAQVEFGEHGRAEDESGGTAPFAAPQGYSADPGRLSLHRKAMAYQHAHPKTEYLTAVLAVS